MVQVEVSAVDEVTAVDATKAQVRLVRGTGDGVRTIDTLAQALLHIEEHHWVQDIIDIPAGQQLLNRSRAS